jgi:hypothetical protein
VRTWLEDETADLSPTMAVLDQRLRWAERLGMLGRDAAETEAGGASAGEEPSAS